VRGGATYCGIAVAEALSERRDNLFLPQLFERFDGSSSHPCVSITPQGARQRGHGCGMGDLSQRKGRPHADQRVAISAKRLHQRRNDRIATDGT
jgi:hypothetical protein